MIGIWIKSLSLHEVFDHVGVTNLGDLVLWMNEYVCKLDACVC